MKIKNLFFAIIMTFLLSQLVCLDPGTLDISEGYKFIITENLAAEALRGIYKYITMVPEEQMDLYHLNYSVNNIVLMDPFNFVQVHPNSLTQADSIYKLSSLINETKSLFFPVMINGKISCLLLLETVGEPRAVSFGYNSIALQFDNLLKNTDYQRAPQDFLISVNQIQEFIIIRINYEESLFLPIKNEVLKDNVSEFERVKQQLIFLEREF